MLLVLEPMRGIRKHRKLASFAIAQAQFREISRKSAVQRAPENPHGNFNDGIAGTCRGPQGAVPVDHGCGRAGLTPCFAIGRKILFRKGPRTARFGERFRHRPEILGLEQKFRQPGKLHEKNVPAAQELRRMGARIFAEHAWMRGIQYSEAAHAVLMPHGASPRYDSAPIVAREHKLLAFQTVRDPEDIADKIRHRISLPALRLAALVVAALVGNDNAKARARERAIWPRQPYQNSGNPCNKMTTGPSWGPAAAAWMVTSSN
jgi:hypothetical protein